MKIIRKELISQIIEEINCNEKVYEFISVIISSWHLDNLLVFLNNNELSRGIIIVLPQSNIEDHTRYRVNESHLLNIHLPNSIIFFVRNPNLKLNNSNILRRFLNSIKPTTSLYLITPGGVNLKLLSLIPIEYAQIRYVVIDEGAGSYISSLQFRINKDSATSNIWTLKYLLKYTKHITLEFIKNILIKATKISITYHLIFKQDGKSLTPDRNICESLSKYYISQSKNNNIENKVIFFKDLNLWEGNSLIPLYIELFDLCLLRNVKVIVKKHPNDKDKLFNDIVNKYENIQIIEYGNSGEQLIADYKPECIIGGMSTIIFTAPFIFNIPTYSFMLKYKYFKSLPTETNKTIDILFNQLKDKEPELTFIENLNQIKF